MASRGLRASVAAALAALLLAACSAGVPPTGKVVSVNPVPPPTEPIPSLNGSDPQPGLSETDVAKGYMYAMADEDPTRAARWVVPGKARQLVEHWSQRTPVNVYDSLEPKAPGVKRGARIAPIQVSRVGRLEHGRDWTPDTGDQTIDLELRRSGSEWRVANPQERWIDLTSFKRLYGPVDLFLVAGDGQHLAPVSGFLQRPPLGATPVASLEQRTAGALRWLLDGPQGRVARALRTAIPRGTQLRDVSYRDGVATVNLSGRFAAPDEGLSGKLRVGQVVWTVTRLLQTAQVRILVDGKPVGQVGPDHFNPADLSGGLLQPTVPALAALWPQRSSASNSPQVLFVRKGEVYAVPPEPNQQPNVVPLQTPGAKSAPTWSPNHQWIAFLLTSGGAESLLVGQPGKGQAAPIGALGSWLSPPSWSPDSRRVYVLAHQAGDVRLLVADLLDWSVQEGNLPRLPDDLQPASLAVSPDGAFVLAVGVHPGADPSAGGELFLGTLGPQGVIGWFPRQIAPGLGEVSSPVWVDPFTVAFIAQTDVKDDLNKLWVMKSDGWNPVAVVNVDPGNGPAIDLGKQVAVDPAGANFVFTVRSENGTSLWIVDRQGSNLRALTTPIPNDFASDPSFASH